MFKEKDKTFRCVYLNPPKFVAFLRITDTAYEAEIKKVTTLLEAYNTALSSLDDLSSTLDAAEKKLGIYSTKVLDYIGTKFGRDSLEYEMAGGVRTSAIKRKSSKSKKAL